MIQAKNLSLPASLYMAWECSMRFERRLAQLVFCTPWGTTAASVLGNKTSQTQKLSLLQELLGFEMWSVMQRPAHAQYVLGSLKDQYCFLMTLVTTWVMGQSTLLASLWTPNIQHCFNGWATIWRNLDRLDKQTDRNLIKFNKRKYCIWDGDRTVGGLLVWETNCIRGSGGQQGQQDLDHSQVSPWKGLFLLLGIWCTWCLSSDTGQTAGIFLVRLLEEPT